MALTHSEQLAIRQALAEWLEAPHLPELAGLARKLEALPVYADPGGALLLAPSGNVIAVPTNQSWDDDALAGDATPESVLVAHLEAARRHRALSFLEPRRPPTAVDCDQCSASGWLSVSGSQFRCGRCNGLGWQPTS